MRNIKTTRTVVTLRHAREAWLVTSLFATGGVTHAACNPSIALTRPDSRYEPVASAKPAGSEVRDKLTGLVWQRCVMGMVWDGTTCIGRASNLNWQNALDAARTVTARTVSASAAWRVPSISELYSLAERSCENPAINTTWFPATPSDWTWSSSPFANYSDYAWYVNFSNGYGGYDGKYDANRVRLVRSGP